MIDVLTSMLELVGMLLLVVAVALLAAFLVDGLAWPVGLATAGSGLLGVSAIIVRGRRS